MKKMIYLFIMIFLITISSLKAQQWGDYTLYSLSNSSNAYLIDTNSNVYHSWTFSSTAKTAYSTYLLEGGTVIRTVTYPDKKLSGGPISGQIQKVDWDGNLIWDYIHSSSTYCLHHDICPMPNGNVLMISYEVKSASEATAAGSSQNITIWSEKIIEVKPTGLNTGEIVWEWHFWDHLCQNYNSSKDNYVTSIVQHPELLNINYKTQKDWIHMNGISYNPDLDQIVVSSHNMNEIYVIDHSTTTAQAASHLGGNAGKGGDILYRWGNPAAYSATGTTIFNVVHDAHWVPSGFPNAGMLVGFNNNGVSTSKSSVDLLTPPISGYNYSITLGSAYKPTTYDKRIACNGYTSSEGGSQQLPNGNMLITIAKSGYIYEIDSDGNSIWSKSLSGGVAKAYRYSKEYVSGSSVTITASSSVDLNNVCPSTSLKLSSTGSGGTSYTYSWVSSPAGFTSTLQNPVVKPTQTTTYTVTISSGSNSGKSSVTVTVNPKPTAIVSTKSSTTFCAGDSVILSATTGTGYLYQWRNDGSLISNAINSDLIVKASGNYSVIVTNSSACVDTSTITLVKVNNLPDATINSNGKSEFCVGDSILLTTVGDINNKYQWLYNDSIIDNANSSSFYAKKAGDYNVIVTNSSGCKSISSNVTIEILQLPIADAGKDVYIQKGESVTLTANGGTSYLWNTGQKQKSITVKPDVSTKYSVIVYNENNCFSSDDVIVNVADSKLSVTINSTSKIICAGDEVTLTADVFGGTTSIIFEWFNDAEGILSTENTLIVKPKISTLYHLKVKNADDTATAEFQIVVNPVPSKPSITMINDTLYSSIENSYLWFINGFEQSIAVSQYLVPMKEGKYQVKVFNEYGCGSELSDDFNYESTNIEFNEANQIKILPNPTKGIFRIDGTNFYTTDYIIDIYDNYGRKILSLENNNNIDISEKEAGVYYLIIKSENRTSEFLKLILIK